MERRRTAIYLIVIVSLLAGLASGRPFFFTVTYSFAGLLVVSFVWAWSSVNWLKMTRMAHARRAQVGGVFEEHLSARNVGLLPKLWVEFYDDSDLPGHQASTVISNLRIGAEAAWDVRTRCVRRGEFRLGPLSIVSGDPFGLFEIERKVGFTSRLLVYPVSVPIGGAAAPAGMLPGGEALQRRTHIVTPNAAGVREYAPGDGFNRIHWPSTARRERLLVKEFELDPLADVWIALDMEQSVQASLANEAGETLLPPATEEYAVAAAASLAGYFLEKDRSVGLLAGGRAVEVIQPDRGARQLARLMEMLAVIHTGGGTSLGQLLAVEGEQLARGVTLLIITPSTREEWVGVAEHLAGRGVRAAAVLIDPETFGGRPGMRLLLNRLGAARIAAAMIRCGDDLGQALSRLT